jgi:hypothetical protein
MPMPKKILREFRYKNWVYPALRLGDEIDRILEEFKTQTRRGSKAKVTPHSGYLHDKEIFELYGKANSALDVSCEFR